MGRECSTQWCLFSCIFLRLGSKRMLTNAVHSITASWPGFPDSRHGVKGVSAIKATMKREQLNVLFAQETQRWNKCCWTRYRIQGSFLSTFLLARSFTPCSFITDEVVNGTTYKDSSPVWESDLCFDLCTCPNITGGKNGDLRHCAELRTNATLKSIYYF